MGYVSIEESDGEGAGSRVVKELQWESALLHGIKVKPDRRRQSDKRIHSTLKQTGTLRMVPLQEKMRWAILH